MRVVAKIRGRREGGADGDTTWSAIGASLWHLAQHPEDRRRWVEEPRRMHILPGPGVA